MNIPVNLAAGSLTDRATRVATVAKAYADEVDRVGRFPQEAVDAMKAERLLSIQVPSELGGESACRHRQQGGERRREQKFLHGFPPSGLERRLTPVLIFRPLRDA